MSSTLLFLNLVNLIYAACFLSTFQNPFVPFTSLHDLALTNVAKSHLEGLRFDKTSSAPFWLKTFIGSCIFSEKIRDVTFLLTPKNLVILFEEIHFLDLVHSLLCL